MHTCFDDLNGKKLVIGLVHLLPMVSTPLYQDGNLDKMTKKAIEDCLTLKKNGADGGLIQTVDVFYPSPGAGRCGTGFHPRCPDHDELHYAFSGGLQGCRCRLYPLLCPGW